MKAKPVIPRGQASRDIDEALDYYLSEGATQAALDLVEDLERAYAHIGRFPASGSPRYAHELDLPGLRCWPLARHPYLVFFIERTDHVDVLRVLHSKRDVPAWMQ